MGKALTKIIEIGSMDRRISLETNNKTKDAYGGPVNDTNFAISNIPAAIDYMRGNESEEDGKESVFDYVSFTIRFNASVDHTYSVIYDSKTYDIERIEEVGRKRFTKLYCKYVK